MRTRIVTFTVAVVACVCLCGCTPAELENSPTISVGAQWDYKTAIGEVLIHPDPNSAFGLWAVRPAEFEAHHLGFGLMTHFALGDVYDASLDLIFPGLTNALADVPAKPWGRLGLAIEDDNWDMMFLAGTGVEFLPTESIRPVVWTDWLVYEGSTPDDVHVTFGFMIEH